MVVLCKSGLWFLAHKRNLQKQIEMIPKFFILFWIILISLCGFIATLYADIVYLKNGNRIEGFIKQERGNKIELIVEGGTIQLFKSEIERIYKSSPAETEITYKKWERNKQDYEWQGIQAQLERNKALEEWKIKDAQNKGKGNLQDKEQAGDKGQIKEGFHPLEVEVSKYNAQIFVEALLNDRVKTKLILDTGASLVMITEKVALQAGIDTDNLKQKVQLQLADGSKIDAKYTILKRISIQGARARNIETAVMPDNFRALNDGYGILGMSFLKRFNFKIDVRNNKLLLETVE